MGRGCVFVHLKPLGLPPLSVHGTASAPQVLKVGRSIATIAVDLRDESSGTLVAQGTHVKFVSEKEPDLSQMAARAGLPPPPPPPAQQQQQRAKL